MEGLSLQGPDCVVLLGNETKEVVFHVTGGESAASNSYPLEVTFDAAADGKAVLRDTLHVNVISRKTMTIDGDLKDWAGILPQTTAADAGLGRNLTEKAWLPFVPFEQQVANGVATGYLAYDDQNFYFAAKIADDTPDEGTLRYATRDDDSYFYPAKSFLVDGKQRKELAWPEGVRRFSYRRNFDIPSNNSGDSVQVAFGVFPPGENGMLAHVPGTPLDFQARKCTDYEYVFNSVAQRVRRGDGVVAAGSPGRAAEAFLSPPAQGGKGRRPGARRQAGDAPRGQYPHRGSGHPLGRTARRPQPPGRRADHQILLPSEQQQRHGHGTGRPAERLAVERERLPRLLVEPLVQRTGIRLREVDANRSLLCKSC